MMAFRPHPITRTVGLCLLLFAIALPLPGAETIPPMPAQQFNDYAGVVSTATAQRLDAALENLEKTDGTQIVVAIFQKMQSDSALEDYTVRVAREWRAGRAGLNNGAILFVFIEDRAVRIEVGYGLEGAIPDATAKRIIENEIIPHFRNGNFEQGLAAGTQALIQAAQGEYQGTGRTVGGSARRRGAPPWVGFLIFLFILFAIIGSTRRRRGYSYRRGGRTVWGGPFIGGWGGGSGWGGGGGFGGGGFGGGFSGGGGSFGGGGASGRW